MFPEISHEGCHYYEYFTRIQNNVIWSWWKTANKTCMTNLNFCLYFIQFILGSFCHQNLYFLASLNLLIFTPIIAYSSRRKEYYDFTVGGVFAPFTNSISEEMV